MLLYLGHKGTMSPSPVVGLMLYELLHGWELVVVHLVAPDPWSPEWSTFRVATIPYELDFLVYQN